MVSGPLTEFFLQKIQAQLQEKGKNMTPTIRFGCALLCKAFTIHADNTELFEEVLVHFRDKDVPFALTVELKSFPFQLLEGTMDTKKQICLCTQLFIIDSMRHFGRWMHSPIRSG